MRTGSRIPLCLRYRQSSAAVRNPFGYNTQLKIVYLATGDNELNVCKCAHVHTSNLHWCKYMYLNMLIIIIIPNLATIHLSKRMFKLHSQRVHTVSEIALLSTSVVRAH